MHYTPPTAQVKLEWNCKSGKEMENFRNSNKPLTSVEDTKTISSQSFDAKHHWNVDWNARLYVSEVISLSNNLCLLSKKTKNTYYYE